MSSTTRSALLAGGIGILFGASAFWLLATGRQPTTVPSEPLEVASRQTDRRLEAAPLLEAAALRAAVREEVRAAVQDEAATAQKKHEAAKSAEQAERTELPVPTQSYETARGYVADRLTQGSWSERDRDRMGSLLASMNERERDELMRQVIVAVNKGQLQVTHDGPLF
jgi:hypothetical protein